MASLSELYSQRPIGVGQDEGRGDSCANWLYPLSLSIT